MRADRLIQTLLLLQGRPQITAAELAEELEVSVPTARRDLEALAMSGVPIFPTRGRGGGWRLIGGARTDLTGLTEGEVTSLLIGLAQNRDAMPERVAAMRKLMRAVPEPFREGAERVAAATVRDVPWGVEGEEAQRPVVSLLQRAVAARRRVRFEYDGATGATSVDLIPLVVGSRGARWYLLGAPPAAGSDLADADRLRTYRVDRMRAPEMLAEAGQVPPGFDVTAAWARMVERVESLRGEARAIVQVEPWAVRALCDRFGVQARVLDEGRGTSGLTRVEVSAHRTDALAEQLAGWTTVAEVIEPAEVREALRLLGERIVARYSEGGQDRVKSPG